MAIIYNGTELTGIKYGDTQLTAVWYCDTQDGTCTKVWPLQSVSFNYCAFNYDDVFSFNCLFCCPGSSGGYNSTVSLGNSYATNAYKVCKTGAGAGYDTCIKCICYTSDEYTYTDTTPDCSGTGYYNYCISTELSATGSACFVRCSCVCCNTVDAFVCCLTTNLIPVVDSKTIKYGCTNEQIDIDVNLRQSTLFICSCLSATLLNVTRNVVACVTNTLTNVTCCFCCPISNSSGSIDFNFNF